MPKKITMKDRIWNYLNEVGSISSWDAFRDLGCCHLQEYIRQFRNDGIDIKDKWITVKNRYGEKVAFKEYWIEKEK